MLESSEEDTSSNSDTPPDIRDKRRRKQFSVQEKRQILDEIDRGIKKCMIAKKYHISSSTISTFLKNREKIVKSSYSPFVDPQRKRVKAAHLSKIEKTFKSISEEHNRGLTQTKPDSSSRLQESIHCNNSPGSISLQKDIKESGPSQSEGSAGTGYSQGKRKRQQFSLQEKKLILEALDKGIDPKLVAKEFGVNESTIFTFIRCKKQIQENILKRKTRLKAKRFRQSPFEAIDKALYNWILQSKSESFPVNDKLRDRALFFADSFGITNFKGSTGWLYRFKDHYGIYNNIKMKSMKEDDDDVDEPSSDILKTPEKKKRKSPKINNPQNTSKTVVHKIKYPSSEESPNVIPHHSHSTSNFRQQKVKRKRNKKSNMFTSPDITNVMQNKGNSELTKYTSHSTLSEVFKKSSQDVINKESRGHVSQDNTCNASNSYCSRANDRIKSDLQNIEVLNDMSPTNSAVGAKDDSIFSIIVSASDAAEMANKLRQFIMAHKDIPNYVQDSCDIICDYTERCVQQEKSHEDRSSP